jgi:hypothetical protein
MAIDHVSASSIVAYLTNHFMFYKDYVLKQRDFKDSVATLTGKAMHTSIENTLLKKKVDIDDISIATCKNAKGVTLEQIEEVFKMAKKLDKYIESPDTKLRAIFDCIWASDKFLVEKAFLVPITTKNGITMDIKGFIDCAYFNGKKAVIIDWKSVSKFTTKPNLKYIIQGLIYAIPLLAEGYDIEEILFVEIKKTANRDGSDICNIVKLDLTAYPEVMEWISTIIEAMVKDIETKKIWLPNVSDMFDTDPISTLREAITLFSK